MQFNLTLTEKKAVKASIEQNWDLAITLNKQILDHQPNDVKALTRLGVAQLNLKKFSDAIKTFEQVLKLDPINKVAQKNLNLAKNKKTSNNTMKTKKALIIEPGLSQVFNAKITKKGFTTNSLSYGDEFEIIPLKSKINILLEGKLISEIPDPKTSKKLADALEKGAKIKGIYIKGENKSFQLIIKSTLPVFKGEKQDVKPYMKKGTIEEPELEIESFDDE